MSAKTRTQTLHVTCIFCCTRHKPDFGWKSEAGKSEAIASARQHRPEGQNPIALTSTSEKCGASMAVCWHGVPDLRKIVDQYRHSFPGTGTSLSSGAFAGAKIKYALAE